MLFEDNGVFDQKLHEAKSFNFDQIQTDVIHMKKTLKGWTKLFTQIMELQIQSSKQHQQNVINPIMQSIMLQQILQSLPPQKLKNKKTDNLNISPIKMVHHKTEVDEKENIYDSLIKQENLSKIFNNQKKMSIMHFQGTPFDSAYESINRELQLGEQESQKQIQFPINDDDKFRISQTVHKSNGMNYQQEMLSLPQSAKNADNRQFVFNSTKNLPKYSETPKSGTQIQKENFPDKNNQQKLENKKVKIKEPKLSTVIEESTLNMSPYVGQNKNYQTPTILAPTANSCCNKQSFTGFEFQINHSRTPTSSSNNKPANYFIENANPISNTIPNNNRSGSKSLYQNNNQTQKPQQQLPFKQQFEIMTQRAKSYSEQNGKKNQKKQQFPDK